MEKNEFHYDAFISYRHSDKDKFVAENLHKMLESFRLPKSAAKKTKNGKDRVERVFRDKEELPLTSDLNDPIMNAIHNADWLIVICSPRLRESLWCKKEIETFVRLHGREHVLAVLIEGEPKDSFPDELLYRIEEVTLPDGSKEERRIPVEPLAADVRGRNNKEILKLLKIERLRILAAMFHLNYDDLRQRHKERKLRRILAASFALSAFCLFFGLYCAATTVHIQKQNEILAQNQAVFLNYQAQDLLSQDDREGAIALSYRALTEYEGMQMPYTPEAQMTLTEALHCYDFGTTFSANFQIETNGIISQMTVSPNGECIAVVDDTGILSVIHVNTREKLFEEQLEYSFGEKDKCVCFVDDTTLVFLKSRSEIVVYDLASGNVKKSIEEDFLNSIYLDAARQYLACNILGGMKVYDTISYTEVANYEVGTGKVTNFEVVFSNDSKIVCFTEMLLSSADGGKIHFLQTEGGKELFCLPCEGLNETRVRIEDETVYILECRQEENQYFPVLSAYQLNDGGLLWSWQGEESDSVTDLVLPRTDSDILMVMGYKSVYLIHKKSGELFRVHDLDSWIAQGSAYDDKEAFRVILKNGEYYYLPGPTYELQDVTALLDSRIDELKYYFSGAVGPMIVPDNSNRIVVYSMVTGKDVVSLSELPEKEEIQFEYTSGYHAQERLKELNIESPQLVYGVFNSPDNRYLFIQYTNYEMVIYDQSRNCVVSSFKTDSYMFAYLGETSNGNTYIGDYFNGYVLNKDMECCGYIPGLLRVNEETDELYLLDAAGGMYAAPSYTLKELLKMAEEYL